LSSLSFSLLASTYFFLSGSGRDGRLATVKYKCSGRFGPKATAGATCWLFVSDPSSLLLLSALLASLVLAALKCRRIRWALHPPLLFFFFFFFSSAYVSSLVDQWPP
jgi:hypothetical protein